ncbi:hypothetical protein [Persephonella sp.]
MADIKQEGKVDDLMQIDDLLSDDPTNLVDDEKEKENSADSPAETTNEKEDPSQEGDKTPTEENIPFHKHPRFKQLIEENRKLKELVETSTQKVQEVEGKIEEKLKVEVKDEVKLPRWWSILAGEDEISQQAYKDFMEYDKEQRARIKQELLEEQQRQEQEQKEVEERWNKWVDEEIKSMQDEGLEFDKNELIKIAVDFQPTDQNGNISLRKAYDILKLQKKDKDSLTEKKKEIASKTSSSSNKDPEVKQFNSSIELRNRSWTSLIED